MRAFLLFVAGMISIMVALMLNPTHSQPTAKAGVSSWYQLETPVSSWSLALSPVAPSFQKEELSRFFRERAPWVKDLGFNSQHQAMYSSFLFEDMDWYSHTPVSDRVRGPYGPSTRAANKLARAFLEHQIEEYPNSSYEDLAQTTLTYIRSFGRSYGKAFRGVSSGCSKHLQGDPDCVALATQLIWF